MKVRFTRTAQRDLAQIHAYISEDSPVIASRFVARLIERSRKLARLRGFALENVDFEIF